MTMAWNRALGPSESSVDTGNNHSSLLVDTTQPGFGYVITFAPDNNTTARQLGDLSQVVWTNSHTLNECVLAFVPGDGFVQRDGLYRISDGVQEWGGIDIDRAIYDEQLDYIIAYSSAGELTAYDPADGSELSWGGSPPADNGAYPAVGLATSNNRVFLSGTDSGSFPNVHIFDITDGSYITSTGAGGSSFNRTVLHTTDTYCYTYAHLEPNVEVKRIAEDGSVTATNTISGDFRPEQGSMSGDGSIYLHNADDSSFPPSAQVNSLDATTLNAEWSDSQFEEDRGQAVVPDTDATAVWPTRDAFYLTDTTGSRIGSRPFPGSPGPTHTMTGNVIVKAGRTIRTLEYDGRVYETWNDAKTRPYHNVNSRLRT